MPRSDKIQLTEKDIQQIQTLSGLGLTVPQISAALGISKKTLERRVAEDPTIKDALEKGRALAASQVTKTLFKMATNGRNTAATIFWIKTRLRWSEVQGMNIAKEDSKLIIDFGDKAKENKKESGGTNG